MNATAAATAQTFTAYEGSTLSGEALLFVKSGENAVISGNVLAGNLTKFGDGTLTLSGSGAVLGDVNVQDGTLKLGASNPFSRLNSELNINSGATLDLNGGSVAVETLGANNRQVTGTGGGVNFGGSITNTSGTASTLAVASPVASFFTGTLNGNLKLLKAGTGVLTIDGYRASTPDSGQNTFTGGTDIYGVGNTGGILVDNAPFAFGGANGSTLAPVNLYGGTLDLRYSGNATTFGLAGGTNAQTYNNLTVRLGADGTDGLTLNVRGPSLVNVNQSTGGFGQGNIWQVGALNMTNTTLQISGGNLYRFRAAGPTTIQGSQAAFQTNSDGPNGVIELTGVVSGAGTLTKLGDGTMRALVLTNPGNTYSGGTNIVAGDVQVMATSGTPLGSGAVRVFPTGTLHLAANGSVDGSKLEVMSGITQLGAVALGQNFNPTVLTAANFGSVYNNTLQLAQPYFTQALDLSSIGDGRAFLGVALGQEARYMAATLGAGVPDAWNPGVGVYRLVGGTNNLGFDGVDNVLTGSNYLQVGPQRAMVVGGLVNSGNSIIIRNSNNYTGGTQIAEGSQLVIETGGSPVGDRPLGTGAVEVYGTLLIQGNLGSMYNALTAANSNVVTLRPAGQVRIIDAVNTLVAGDNGRWADTQGVDLNGGQFRYDGAANWQSVETIGDVTVRKGGMLTVARSSAASSALLNIGTLTRVDRGSLTLNYNSGFLGVNSSTPDSFERLTTSTTLTLGGNTATGTGASNGIVAPWIIDRVTNSFVGYKSTTGFQPVGTTVALAGGATTTGSPTITVTSTTGMRVGMVVSGTGIPVGATVSAVLSATQFTISQNATSTNTAQTYTT
ncbi:MAG: beta strand repeat-containing protein, partial [Gemmatimonas sp.]